MTRQQQYAESMGGGVFLQLYSVLLTLVKHLTGFKNLSGVGSMLVNTAVNLMRTSRLSDLPVGRQEVAGCVY